MISRRSRGCRQIPWASLMGVQRWPLQSVYAASYRKGLFLRSGDCLQFAFVQLIAPLQRPVARPFLEQVQVLNAFCAVLPRLASMLPGLPSLVLRPSSSRLTCIQGSDAFYDGVADRQAHAVHD